MVNLVLLKNGCAYFNRAFYCAVFITLLACLQMPLNAGEDAPNSIAHGLTNAGVDFWCSLPPMPAFVEDNVVINVASPYKTTVRISVPVLGEIRSVQIQPFKAHQFNIHSSIAMMFRAAGNFPVDEFFDGRAINIQSEDPIVASVSVRSAKGGESTILTPSRALGTGYVVGTFNDASNFYPDELLPASLTVCAIEGDTKVFVTLGGNATTTTNAGMESGDTKAYTLQRGDLLVIATTSPDSDLSGTYVLGTKPLAVYAGNACARVPLSAGDCNYLLKGHLPISSYGNNYHVPALNPRTGNHVVRVFSEKRESDVWLDNQQFGTILEGKGGTQNFGFISRVIHDGDQRNATIWSEDPISVTLLATGAEYDGSENRNPFAIELVPVAQYSRYSYFTVIPRGTDSEKLNAAYLTIIHAVDASGMLAADLEIAQVNNDGQLEWRPLRSIAGSEPGRIFERQSMGHTWAEKLVELPQSETDENTFAIRSAGAPFGAYITAFVDGYMQGMRAGSQMKNFEFADDKLAPEAEDAFSGIDFTFAGSIIDKSDVPEAAGLASVWLDPDCSFNVEFEIADFERGSTEAVAFSASVIDPKKTALGTLVATDRMGNSLRHKLEYTTETPGLYAQPNALEFVKSQPGDTRLQTLQIVNYSVEKVEIRDLQLANTATGMVIVDAPTLPYILEPQATLPLSFRWVAGGQAGQMTNQLLITTADLNAVAIAELQSHVIDGKLELDADFYDFGDVKLHVRHTRSMAIRNNSDVDVWITQITPPGSFDFQLDLSGGLLADLDSGQEVRLQPGIAASFEVQFAPSLLRQNFEQIYIQYRYCDLEERRLLLAVNGSGIDPVSSVGALQSAPSDLRVEPNPAHSSGQLRFNLPQSQKLTVQVFDIRGNLLLNQPARWFAAGQNYWDLGLEDLGSGAYYLQLISDDSVQTVNFVIQK